MDLGTKIKEARLAAGLSQRQLCGDVITRNMLSRIENGFARPSMDTLQHLAAGLEKPVSYFLEEDGAVSRNLPVMERGRSALAGGQWQQGLEALSAFREPDPVLLPEKILLEMCLLLGAACSALEERREPYCRELLSRAEALLPQTIYQKEALFRQLLLIRGQLKGENRKALASCLPDMDQELMLRARGAEDPARAAQLLDAAQTREGPWLLLRGKAHMDQGEYGKAMTLYRAAEAQFPLEAARALEICSREMGDFRSAYTYACKVRCLCE